MLRGKGRVACVVIRPERPKEKHEPAEPIRLLSIMSHSTQFFAVLSVVIYAYGFLAVRGRLGAIDAPYGLSVADPRYLVEGTKLLLTIMELLFPYAFASSCGVALFRAIRAIRGVTRLLRGDRADWSLRCVINLASIRRLLSSLLVVALMRASLVAPLSAGAAGRDSTRLMWAVLNGKVQSACSGSCRFELVALVFIASIATLIVLPRSDWISLVGWTVVAFQAMLIPIIYSQLIRVPVPVVTLDRGPIDSSKPFTAYLIWSTDSECLFHDGHQLIRVPTNSIGPMRIRCTILVEANPTKEPRCDFNEQTTK